MTQRDINRAVARCTGESTTLIDQMGFVLLTGRIRRRRKQARAFDRQPPASHREPSSPRLALRLA